MTSSYRSTDSLSGPSSCSPIVRLDGMREVAAAQENAESHDGVAVDGGFGVVLGSAMRG